MRKVLRSAVGALLCLALLAGCQGKALPEGMDRDALLEAGKDVMLLVVQGEYETVLELFRPDIRETISVEDIQSLALRQLDGAGVYKQIQESMTTGQSGEGEEYGIAVLYCEFSEKDVLFRLAFDVDMTLMGIDIQLP